MKPLSVEDLRGRVERLERDNARFKKAGVVFALAAVAWVVMGTGLVRPLKQVSAERFVLKDGKGHIRAGLGLRIDGSPELAMFDGAGKRLLALQTAADDSGSLHFYDHDELRVSMGSTPDGTSVLNFMDRRGKSSAGFYMWPDSSTGLGFRGGKQNIDLRIRPDGESRLSFTDRGGNEIAGIGAPPNDSTLVGSSPDGESAEPASSPQAHHRRPIRPSSGGRSAARLAP